MIVKSTLHIGGSMQESFGGPPQALKATVIALNKLAVDTCFITVESKKTTSRYVKVPDSQFKNTHVEVKVNSLAARYQFALKVYSLIRKFALDSDVIIVHGFYTFSTFLAIRTKKSHGKPVVVMPHGSLEPYQGKRNPVRKKIFRMLFNSDHIDAFAVATQAEKDSLRQNNWIKSPIEVVGFGITNEFVSNDKSKSSESLDFRYILFIGRIASKKRIDICVDAVKILQKQHPKLKLIIAGMGENELVCGLKSQINLLQLDENIELIGEVSGSAKWSIISNAEMTILPSENENFAVSVAESLSVHTPTIVSRNVGLSELVSRSQAGVVMKELSPKELATCIELVLKNREFYVQNTLEAIKELSIDKVAKNWENLFHILNLPEERS